MKFFLSLMILISTQTFAGVCTNPQSQNELNECSYEQMRTEMDRFETKLTNVCLKKLGVRANQNPRDVLGSMAPMEINDCIIKKVRAIKVK